MSMLGFWYFCWCPFHDRFFTIAIDIAQSNMAKAVKRHSLKQEGMGVSKGGQPASQSLTVPVFH